MTALRPWHIWLIVMVAAIVVAVPVTLGGAGQVAAQTGTPEAITIDGDDCDDVPAAARATSTATRTSGDDDDDDDDRCVEIDTKDLYFDPNVITLPADEAITIVLHNEGQAIHNFSVTDHNNAGLENLNISVTVDPGQTKAFTIQAPAGDYYFFCDQPGHEAAGMRGYLQVSANAEIDTDEATVTPRAG